MDTLSLVSKYLNGMEDLLDDGDSLEAKKLTIGKSKEALELFEALDHKSVIVNEGSHKLLSLKKVPPHAYSKPFIRFSLPCDVDGQVIGYANEGEPSVIFSRDILVTSKSRVDFGIGEMRIDLTMLEEMKDIDVMLDALVENSEEVGSSNGYLVKMGKASGNKNQNVNKLTPPPQIKIEEIPSIFAIAPPSPIYHPLTQKQNEKVKEALDRKYKELKESKPILEVLENYMTYRKKLNEVLMGRARLSSDDYGEEENMRIVEHRLPKKMCDPGNFVLPVKVNGTIEMSALADIGASVSVLPYCLFKNLGLGDPKPYNSNLTMADNTQAKAMGEVKNKLIDFLGSLPVQLKNTDWGNECYETYKKVEGDGAWHAKFEVTTPSERKFTRVFKTKKTDRKLSGKFTSEDILKFDQFLD
ncbi:zinc finger, CCHC-type containing protein [Tanacetum coccineum]